MESDASVYDSGAPLGVEGAASPPARAAALADGLEAHLATLSTARQAMASRSSSACAHLITFCSHLTAELGAHQRAVAAVASASTAQLEKEMDAEAEALCATSDQLLAAARMCEDGVAWAEEEEGRGLLDVMARLADAVPEQAVCSFGAAPPLLSSTADVLAHSAHLCSSVSAERSEVTGPCLAPRTFIPGTSHVATAHNRVRVCLQGDAGEDITCATVGDVLVRVDVRSVVPGVYVSQDGGIEVTFVVEAESLPGFTLAISVFGTAVLTTALSPACGAMGVYERGIHSGALRGNTGIAITPDCQHIIVSNAATHDLRVLSVCDGSLVHRLGGHGSGPGKFLLPLKMCWSPLGSLLVADSGNKRVQEWDAQSWTHMRDVGEGAIASEVASVACGDGLIAAGMLNFFTYIYIFDYESGALLTTHNNTGYRASPVTCVGLCFLRDASLLCAHSMEQRLDKMSPQDETAAEAFAETGLVSPVDIALLGSDELAVLDEGAGCVCVLDAGGVVLRRFMPPGPHGKAALKLRAAEAVAVRGQYLYVVDRTSPLIHVFL